MNAGDEAVAPIRHTLTPYGIRALRVSRRWLRGAGQAADIAAVDRGEVLRVILGSFRGDYGRYRHLPAGLLYLEPERPVLRFLWRRVPVAEQIMSARVRPFRG